MMMEKYLSLKEALESAKEGELIGFESLYFMTFEEAFGQAWELTGEEGRAKSLVKEAYKELYRDISRAPATGEFPDWLRFIIEDTAYRQYQIEPGVKPEKKGAKPALTRRQIAAYLVEMEGQMGVFDKDLVNRAPWGLYKYKGFTKIIIILDIILLVVVLTAVVAGVVRIRGLFQFYDEKENPFESTAVETTIPLEDGLEYE